MLLRTEIYLCPRHPTDLMMSCSICICAMSCLEFSYVIIDRDCLLVCAWFLYLLVAIRVLWKMLYQVGTCEEMLLTVGLGWADQ
uniref:Uncharacterized protein n=1 Tax=Arundo donax TaxID=35708 RepID=A0A0A9H6K5_ARUDO